MIKYCRCLKRFFSNPSLATFLSNNVVCNLRMPYLTTCVGYSMERCDRASECVIYTLPNNISVTLVPDGRVMTKQIADLSAC